MKKLKKISLKKEKIVNLNNREMKDIKGGTGWSSKPCDIAISISVSKVLDYTESMLKDNTVWVGCTTDPERSKAYATPGCIAP